MLNSMLTRRFHPIFQIWWISNDQVLGCVEASWDWIVGKRVPWSVTIICVVAAEYFTVQVKQSTFQLAMSCFKSAFLLFLLWMSFFICFSFKNRDFIQNIFLWSTYPIFYLFLFLSLSLPRVLGSISELSSISNDLLSLCSHPL